MNSILVSSPELSVRDAAAAGPCPTELDARGSTPPDRLKAILAALAAIPAGAPQFVRTKAEPIPLLRALAAQGVRAEISELPDGSWQSILRRPAASPTL